MRYDKRRDEGRQGSSGNAMRAEPFHKYFRKIRVYINRCSIPRVVPTIAVHYCQYSVRRLSYLLWITPDPEVAVSALAC